MLPYLDRMIEAMSEAVLVSDADGPVVRANEAVSDLLDIAAPQDALSPLSQYDSLSSPPPQKETVREQSLPAR